MKVIDVVRGYLIDFYVILFFRVVVILRKKIRASLKLAPVRLTLMSGETLTCKFLFPE